VWVAITLTPSQIKRFGLPHFFGFARAGLRAFLTALGAQFACEVVPLAERHQGAGADEVRCP